MPANQNPGGEKHINVLHTLFKTIGITLLSIFIGFILLCAVYLLPTEKMAAHVQESGEMLIREGNYLVWSHAVTMSDGFTDCIILNHAIYDNSRTSLLRRVLLNPETFPADSEKYAGKSRIERALGSFEEGVQTVDENYGRYWHGYLTLIKPLLLISDVAGIRVLNMLVQTFLLILCSGQISKRLGYAHCLILFAFVLFMPPVTAALSFQFSSIYLITLISVLLLFHFESSLLRFSNAYTFFLIIGVCTAYFDLLTSPVVALGVPLAFWVLLSGTPGLAQVLGLSAGWGIGYAGMWSGKWILANLLTSENVLADAQGAARLRIGNHDGAYQRYEGFRRVLVCLDRNPIAVLFIILIVLLLLSVLVKRRHLTSPKRLLALAIICLYPFAWDAVFLQHTAFHWWMTWRNMAVFSCALTALLLSCFGSRSPLSPAHDNTP